MTLGERTISAGGLEGMLVGDPQTARQIVVLLHGYAMRPEDLSPFAHSIKVPALFCFPRAPLALSQSSFAWWPVDEERRTQELARGPRDLAAESPSTRVQLRKKLSELLATLRTSTGISQLVLGGFSQGGMLACDAILSGEPADGLVLLSSSRIAIEEWQSRRHLLRGLPVLISHGTRDADLSFEAGMALRDFHQDSGANVTWQAFDGGHEIPLIVWRALRTFLKQLPAPSATAGYVPNMCD
jgi:phospholipase/carboxylesterase